MKTLIATLLATAAGASFAAAPTFGLNHDPATYRNMTQKAAAAYKAAVDKCEGMKGNDQEVCMAEARLARTRAEADALSRYNTSPVSQTKIRTEIANAEYNVAKARCDGKSGAEKDDCLNNAKSVHTAAVADAKAGRPTSDASNASGSSATGATAAGASAVLVPNDAREKPVEKAADAAANVKDETKSVAAKAAEKTKEVAHAVVEKTKAVAAAVTQKTESALDRTGEKTADKADKADKAADKTADKAADKTADAAAKTRVAAADTAITTKVKAGLVKEPNLESLGIHVETEKGVVMLSGFVNSKAEADKAVAVAKGVEGVSNVKSAIQVK